MITQQRTAKNVTIMPADPVLVQRDIRKKRLRVAPYCRVSTDSDEQLNSYEAQIEYYTAKIQDNPEWTMVRMYADEGISGTSMKKRKEFLKLIADCKKGKVDLVITKSVTRFARNTVDGLQTVRQLKNLGMQDCCEKYNVPYALALAIAEVESHFDPDAKSSTNDFGLMQINAINLDWLRDMGIDPMTPAGNIEAGVYIIAQHLQTYGDPELALMAYNNGQTGAKKRWNKGIYQTGYSQKVMAAYEKWTSILAA